MFTWGEYAAHLLVQTDTWHRRTGFTDLVKPSRRYSSKLCKNKNKIRGRWERGGGVWPHEIWCAFHLGSHNSIIPSFCQIFSQKQFKGLVNGLCAGLYKIWERGFWSPKMCKNLYSAFMTAFSALVYGNIFLAFGMKPSTQSSWNGHMTFRTIFGAQIS